MRNLLLRTAANIVTHSVSHDDVDGWSCFFLPKQANKQLHSATLGSSRDLKNRSCDGVCRQAGLTSRAHPKKAPAVKPGLKATARAASNDMERPKPDLQCTTTE